MTLKESDGVTIHTNDQALVYVDSLDNKGENLQNRLITQRRLYLIIPTSVHVKLRPVHLHLHPVRLHDKRSGSGGEGVRDAI